MPPHSPHESHEGLTDEVAALGTSFCVEVDAGQVQALLRYGALLLAWNARINLTAARTLTGLVSEHFPDAFALAGALGEAEQAVDVGSGGGLPALPLALLRPGLRLQLLEPIAKKAAFLRTAVRELDLGERVAVDTRRAEALAEAGPSAFDVAMSRATLPPPAWVELAVKLVRPGGRIFVLASSKGVAVEHPEVRLRARRSYLDGRRWLIELERRST
jgi:16S rRNA (guanine527-N7)-methyltransferase